MSITSQFDHIIGEIRYQLEDLQSIVDDFKDTGEDERFLAEAEERGYVVLDQGQWCEIYDILHNGYIWANEDSRDDAFEMLSLQFKEMSIDLMVPFNE